MNSPQNLAAQKLAMAKANSAGRSSTNLTTSAMAGATLAGSGGGAYSGTKAGAK